jgi:TatD DNase family protein
VIDTHAHIHDARFDEDRGEVVARALAAGVRHIVTVGCDLADSMRALEIAREYRTFATVGIHPHEAKNAPSDISMVFEPFLMDNRVIAIGETGLDYYYDHSPRDVQQRIFREQLALARDANFPVVFHQRDAYDDFVAILADEWEPGMRGVVHCFSGNAQQALRLTHDFGLFLGVGGVLTFKNADEIREAVRTVGLSWLVLETDCPYLAPMPHRGERNEPAFVALTAKRLAEVLEIPLDEIVVETDANARALFDIN